MSLESLSFSSTGTIDSNHGGSGFSGKTHVLYWSDALSEMAFVVPAPSQGLTTCDPSSSGNINTGIIQVYHLSVYLYISKLDQTIYSANDSGCVSYYQYRISDMVVAVYPIVDAKQFFS